MERSNISVLLLCDDHHSHANTVLDHIDAFLNLSQYQVYKYNPRNVPYHSLLSVNEFDIIVIHYSLPVIISNYVSQDLRKKIHEFKGLKIQYIQDDYRQVDQYTAMMRYLGINVLFTPYPADKIPLVYNEKRLPNVTKLTTLTGYVPDRFMNLKTPPLESRPVDVGYRGRNIPFWLGILSQEKAWIGEGFLKHAVSYELRCDIAWKEEDRIYGNDWDRFISSCKAMLGTESGVSITDFDGSIETKTRAYLALHPNADFWEVYESILKPYEGNLVENTISPRIFECAAHRTAMLLFPGDYSGALQPWVHYIPLQKDFSNIDEVVTKLRDMEFLYTMTERAYKDLIDSRKYSYHAMVEEFDRIVESHLAITPRAHRPTVRFRLAQVESRVVRFLKWFDWAWKALRSIPTRVARALLPTSVLEKIREFRSRTTGTHKFR